MIRLIAILMIALAAGFSGVGAGLVGETAQGLTCGLADCHEVVVEVSCCGTTTVTDYCPKSDGPCRCSAAPLPHRQPLPEGPLPRSDRVSQTAVPNAPVRVVPMTTSGTSCSRGSVQSLGRLAGLTHNEVQAVLGIWRT